jgi:hypothetical protein
MAQHTPGPWRVAGDSENMAEAEVIDSPTRCIAWTANTFDESGEASDGGEIVTEEDIANGRLIASSPDLLAVAKLAQSLLSEEYGDSYEVLKRLDAAIAKAEGSGTQLPKGEV